MSQSSDGDGSDLVIILATIGMVFGIIGMLNSFVPCLGMFALISAVPAAVVSGVATWLAYKKRINKAFPLVALTISTIGIIIAGSQILALLSFGAAAGTGAAGSSVQMK
jgi:hypothetical protein